MRTKPVAALLVDLESSTAITSHVSDALAIVLCVEDYLFALGAFAIAIRAFASGLPSL